MLYGEPRWTFRLEGACCCKVARAKIRVTFCLVLGGTLGRKEADALGIGEARTLLYGSGRRARCYTSDTLLGGQRVGFLLGAFRIRVSPNLPMHSAGVHAKEGSARSLVRKGLQAAFSATTVELA